MDQSNRFWDKVAERYSRQPIADEGVYQTKLRVTREYLRPDMEVLELGCGTGSTAMAHAPYVKHIRAIDISWKMIEIAQETAASSGVTNVTFRQAAIAELAETRNSVDAVLGLSVLHLLENKEDTISRVHRMLKPGGIFVTSTVCIGDTMRFFKFIAPVGRFFGLLPLIKVFTAKELSESLASGGFRIDHRWQPGKGKAVFIVASKIELPQPALGAAAVA